MDGRKEERKERKKEMITVTPTVWESTFSLLSRINICLWTSKGEVAGRDYCPPKSCFSPCSLTPNKRGPGVDGFRIMTTWGHGNL